MSVLNWRDTADISPTRQSLYDQHTGSNEVAQLLMPGYLRDRRSNDIDHGSTPRPLLRPRPAAELAGRSGYGLDAGCRHDRLASLPHLRPKIRYTDLPPTVRHRR